MPRRKVDEVDVAITTLSTTTPAINYEGYAGGWINVATGEAVTTITWYTSTLAAGAEVVPAADGAGVALTTTIASPGSAPIPTELAPASVIYAVGDAAADITITFKD